MLSGEGADEFFGGYSRVQKSPFDFNKKIFYHEILIKKIFDFFLDRYKWFDVREKKIYFQKTLKNN